METAYYKVNWVLNNEKEEEQLNLFTMHEALLKHTNRFVTSLCSLGDQASVNTQEMALTVKFRCNFRSKIDFCILCFNFR